MASHIYCDLAQVRTELVRANGSTTVDDAAITERLPRAAAVLDEFCQHSFDDETVTDEVRSKGGQVLLDRDGVLEITVSKANIQTLTAAAVTLDMVTWYPLDLSRCVTDTYLARFYGYNGPASRSRRMIAKISYQGGYAVVPDLINYAATRITAFLFFVRTAPFEVTAYPSVGQVTIPAKIPPDVGAALAHSQFMRVRP